AIHELRKVMGTSKHIDSSAAFLFEVPGSNLPACAAGTSNRLHWWSLDSKHPQRWPPRMFESDHWSAPEMSQKIIAPRGIRALHAGVWILTFVLGHGGFVYECQNPGDTSKYKFLVWFWI